MCVCECVSSGSITRRTCKLCTTTTCHRRIHGEAKDVDARPTSTCHTCVETNASTSHRTKRAILRTQGRIHDVQHTSHTSPDGKKRAWKHPRVVDVFFLLCICYVSSPFVSIRVVPTHAHVSWPRRIDADASSAHHVTNDNTSSTWCCFTNHVDLLESTASSWVSVEETKTRATEDVRSQTSGHTTNERVVRTKARRGS